MERFTITETAVYTVDAESEQEALELFLAHGPEVSSPVEPVAVTERTVAPEQLAIVEHYGEQLRKLGERDTIHAGATEHCRELGGVRCCEFGADR